MNVASKSSEDPFEHSMSDHDSDSGIMDLADFLSSELTLTLQTVPKGENRVVEEERSYAPRRQSLVASDIIRRCSVKTNATVASDCLADSDSSIATVKISNKGVSIGDLMMDSANKSGCFSMKSLEDLTAILMIPPRDDLTPLHRRSQGNKAA